MISDDDIENWFTHHPPTAGQVHNYETIRDAAKAFARVIVAHTPGCPDQTVAVRKLREVVMIANAAIACFTDR